MYSLFRYVTSSMAFALTVVTGLADRHHCIHVQIAHYPTLSSVPEEMAGPLHAEIDAYKRALRSCYEQYGAKMIAWEISRTAGAKSAHAHIQVCVSPAIAMSITLTISISRCARFHRRQLSERNKFSKKRLPKQATISRLIRVRSRVRFRAAIISDWIYRMEQRWFMSYARATGSIYNSGGVQ